MKLRIATRASKLAMTQSEWVASRLRAHRPDLEVEYVTIETRGDSELKKPLAAIVNKLLHAPVRELKGVDAEGNPELVAATVRLFDLEQGRDEPAREEKDEASVRFSPFRRLRPARSHKGDPT